MQNNRHLNHIETMRAIAALMVALFHFTNYFNGSAFLIQDEHIRKPFEYGAQGVELFYLISGFIIPYSLSIGQYRINHYFHYLSKRVIRLFPPYLVTIAAIFAVNFYLAHFVWGSEFHINLKQLVCNVFFIADFFPDVDWINPIFATLKVELQFYLLIGLLFTLIDRNRYYYVLLCATVLATGIYFNGTDNVFTNSPYFLTGLTAFLIFKDGLKWQHILLFALIFTTLFYYYYSRDFVVNAIGLSLVFLIPRNSRFLHLTGKISYSFYLIHGLCGGWLLYYLSDKSLGANYPVVTIILALLSSWIGAFLMYTLIEKPSLKLSKRIRYRELPESGL